MEQDPNSIPSSPQPGQQQPLPPFSCSYSPNLAELLQQLNASIAITTYQTGKFIFISPKNRDELIQLPRNFPKPMGVAKRENQLALATKDEVILLSNSRELAPGYPKQANTYDSIFIPRATYYTGELDLHDLEWGEKGLYAVNTQYSCISLITEHFNFEPVWKPEFITELAPEDRCHLNGVAFENGKPIFATALGATNTRQGWRENKAKGGVLIDVESQEIILEGLSMPHSPKIYNGQLYLLNSGTGELLKVDVKSGKYDILRQMNGFVRGMDLIGDYLFVGLSKLRTTSKAFQDLPISKKSVFAGIVVIYLPAASIFGYIKYENSVEEIYDIKVIPETQRPGILNTQRPEFRYAFSTPHSNSWAKVVDEGETPDPAK